MSDEVRDVLDAPPCCTACGTYMPQIEAMQQVIRDLQGDLRVKRAAITSLRKSRNDAAAMDPMYPQALEVFEYWRQKVAPDAKEFNGGRRDAVLARLHAGHDQAALKEAIDGCATRPYVADKGRSATGQPDQLEVELELICRNEANLRRFRNYAKAARQRQVEPAADQADPIAPQGKLLRWQGALTDEVAARLCELRGWTPDAIRRLGLGIDRRRVVFPVYDAGGVLRGLLRYQPNPENRHGPKQLAEGPRDLFPPPESIDAPTCWLVEGESDAVAMHSVGLPAVGLPGVGTWKDGWTERFAKFEKVLICLDCDEQGRTTAAARQRDLGAVARATVVDLDPERTDGHDVSDLVHAHGIEARSMLLERANDRGSRIVMPMPRLSDTSPLDKVLDALRAQGCLRAGPIPASGQISAKCPVHNDRAPSLSVSESRDGKVLLRCWAGCDTERILDALGLSWSDAFPEAV